MTDSIANIWMWLGFTVFLITALGVDTLLVHNNERLGPSASLRTAIAWTIFWIACALLFNAFLWVYLYYNFTLSIANEKSLSFFTGYLIEKTLSFDNLFAFYMIFKYFKIPDKYQQRIFLTGIWSAIILRLTLIWFGIWLIEDFHWIIYVMGAFLLLTGIKMLFIGDHEKDLGETITIKVLKRFFRLTHEIQSNHYFIRKDNLLYATPLFVALIFVEMSDIVFAFDSIPAIFAITTDPFLVWTSNVFAILGLRSLYFVLAGMVHRFYMLKYGIALILMLVGVKMLISPWIHVKGLMSLSIIVGILILFSILSLIKPASPKED